MPVKIFCCYARKDQSSLYELKAHLMPLQRQGLITLWADININAGTEWEKEIDEHLNTADIILLLVSPDFMASDYCYSIEMQRALERHERGEAHVIPIILRWTLWKETPIGKLQALPKSGKPITDRGRHTLDYIFCDVAENISTVVKEMLILGNVQKQSVMYEKQILQQMEAMSDFYQATKTRDWEQAEKTLRKYPNLSGTWSLLGLSMSQEVQEYFSYQLHPHNSTQGLEYVGGPSISIPGIQLARIRTVPPRQEAIYWLEQALQNEDNPEGKVTAALALLYGYSEAYNTMIDTIQKANTINPSLISYFQLPDNLMMLMYACHSFASVEEVMRSVSLKLPRIDEVQQALKEASDQKNNPSIFAQPYMEWHAVELKMGDISRTPVKVSIAFPDKNNLTYAQISQRDQRPIILPTQPTTTGMIETQIPVDEILKQLMDNGIILITRI